MSPASSKSSVTHRSRLTRATQAARAERLAELNKALESNLAQFSSLRWGAGGVYHAAQDTRLRAFTGESYVGLKPRVEEEMLRPYDRARIISRARIMVRNNPWLAAMLLAYVEEIGTPTYKSVADLGNADDSKTYNDARERLILSWTKDCEFDTDLSLDQVVRICEFEDCLAGELFIVFLKAGELQLIPSELCGSVDNQPIAPGAKFLSGVPISAGSTEKWGIVRGPNRKIIGYRFAQRDPETLDVDFTAEKTVVIERQYVRHLYDPDRIEQGRGVPKLAPILTKLQDLYETGDARSQQVKNAACLSLWVTKNIDPYGFAESMRGSMRSGDFDTAATLKTLAATRSSYQEIRAGAVYYGGVGEDAKLIEPKLSSGDWHEHYVDLLQVCCACLRGMPVEVGIEGFRNSSYSSARATMNKWKRNVKGARNFITAKLLDPINLWQTYRAELFKEIDSIPADQKEECRWGWPAIPDIDGLKTSLQNASDLSIGATNLRAIYADRGEHYDIEFRQLARERGMLLKFFVEEGVSAGLSKDQARSWALTQMPSGDGRALAALLTATGALSEDGATKTAAKASPVPAAPAE